ncbi:MAG: sugar-binding domain-containing protein [Eubacteriales bacterium]|nr:sugar-binding domain-containing protein [Eubacteriales bacterium]
MISKDRYTDEVSKADFLRSIARMYYVLGMNQQDIAQKLDIGRSSVARFLAEARENGIVQIHIAPSAETDRHLELEERLQTRYRLKDVIVADSLRPQTFCTVAASYISSILPYSGVVALSGGRTNYSIGQYCVSSGNHEHLHFVQTTGILSEAVPSTAVVQTWAEKFKANAIYLSAPGIVAGKEVRQAILNDISVSTAYQALRKADIAITGIGTKDSNFPDVPNTPLSPFLPQIRENCVGDICLHFYDADGEFCIPALSDLVLGLSVIDFLRIPVRIAAAVGAYKADSITAALRGRLINILITDDATAQILLEMA